MAEPRHPRSIPRRIVPWTVAAVLLVAWYPLSYPAVIYFARLPVCDPVTNIAEDFYAPLTNYRLNYKRAGSPLFNTYCIWWWETLDLIVP